LWKANDVYGNSGRACLSSNGGCLVVPDVDNIGSSFTTVAAFFDLDAKVANLPTVVCFDNPLALYKTQ
jgi:hypothetical protein